MVHSLWHPSASLSIAATWPQSYNRSCGMSGRFAGRTFEVKPTSWSNRHLIHWPVAELKLGDIVIGGDLKEYTCRRCCINTSPKGPVVIWPATYLPRDQALDKRNIRLMIHYSTKYVCCASTDLLTKYLLDL
jgi:hypothetical protein